MQHTNKSSLLGKSGFFISQENLNPQNKHLIPLIREMGFEGISKCLTPSEIFFQDSKSRNLLYYACYYNKPDILLYLINKGVPINQLDTDGRNLWHICAYAGSMYCFGILLSHSECLRRMISGKKLKQALQKFQIKKSQYKNGELIVNATQNKTRNFADFKVACQLIVKKYFDSKYEEWSSALSVQDNLQLRTPIHMASLNKYQRCFQVLELMLNQTGVEYKDYLELSQRISSTIQKYQDPRIYNNITIDLQNTMSIKEFEKFKIQEKSQCLNFIKTIINLKDKGGFTALHLASYEGSSQISSLLKKLGAIVSDPDGSQGQNIVEIAKNNSVRQTITDLCQASQKGDKSTINLLINCGQNVNVKKTIFGITPLHNSIIYCEKTNRADPAKILLQNGADIDTQDVNGWTSLHKACEIGNLQMVQLLLQKKANTKKVSNKGWLPLHIAAMNDHYQIIDVLNYKVKDLNFEVKDSQGCTPLILAAKKGANKAVSKLIQLGSNLYAVDNKKMSALHYATFKQHHKTIKALLYYDADFDKLRSMRNCHGKPAKQLSNDSTTRALFDNIWSASREGKLDIVRRLIIQGSDKDQQTFNLKRTPLMYAILGGNILVVKYLLEQGASTYPEDSKQQSASSYVSQYLKSITAAEKAKAQETAKGIKKLLSQFES